MDENEGEFEDESPAITLGDYLRPGEAVAIAVRDEPEAFTSEYADEQDEKDAFRVPAWFLESDYAFEGNDGDELEEGDECVLVSWSTRLNRAMGDAAADLDDSLVGNAVEIEKSGSGYDVTYKVNVIDAPDDLE